MRVTSNMQGRNLLYNLGNSAENLQNLQNQMSSGKKINKPSDNPVGVQNVMRFNSTQTAVDLWKTNTTEAMSYMQTTDSAMSSATSMLQRVRELAVRGSNGDMTQSQRLALSTEIRELNEQIRSVANTKVGNRYIFAGEKNVEPMPTASSPWQGSSAIVSYQVGNNLSIGISIDGGAVFPGIFSTLDDLATALEGSDDAAAVDGASASLGKLDQNIDNLLKNQAELGAKVNRLTSIQSQLTNTSNNLASNISDIQDLDYAQTILDYQTQDNAYRAALAVGMKVIQPSLVDFMR